MDNSSYLKELSKKRDEVLNGEATWGDIANLRISYGEPPLTVDSLRRLFGFYDLFNQFGWINPPKENDISYKETTSIEKDGTFSSDKIIEISDIDKSNPEALLKAHGFNPKLYELVSARNSAWNVYSKKDGKQNLYASKINVKIRKENVITFEDIDRYFSNFKNLKPILTSASQYDPNGEILEICIDDLHAGLLSYGEETGEDYDIHIAKQRFDNAVADILQRCENRKFKKIVFACLGDILHVNNEQNTTVKGTRQDVDSRISKMVDVTLDMLIGAIKAFGDKAPVDVINVPGNHDGTTNYILMKAVEKAFWNNDKITFYNSPNPRKYKRYGKVLIGWCHGEMPHKNITEWLQTEAAKEWGDSIFRECHAGHLHSTQTIVKMEEENSGLIVRHLPTLCSSSAWEHQQAYNKSIKTMVSFVWNEEKGLREIWYSNI